jgi:TolA-binding protein
MIITVLLIVSILAYKTLSKMYRDHLQIKSTNNTAQLQAQIQDLKEQLSNMNKIVENLNLSLSENIRSERVKSGKEQRSAVEFTSPQVKVNTTGVQKQVDRQGKSRENKEKQDLIDESLRMRKEKNQVKGVKVKR